MNYIPSFLMHMRWGYILHHSRMERAHVCTQINKWFCWTFLMNPMVLGSTSSPKIFPGEIQVGKKMFITHLVCVVLHLIHSIIFCLFLSFKNNTQRYVLRHPLCTKAGIPLQMNAHHFHWVSDATSCYTHLQPMLHSYYSGNPRSIGIMIHM